MEGMYHMFAVKWTQASDNVVTRADKWEFIISAKKKNKQRLYYFDVYEIRGSYLCKIPTDCEGVQVLYVVGEKMIWRSRLRKITTSDNGLWSPAGSSWWTDGTVMIMIYRDHSYNSLWVVGIWPLCVGKKYMALSKRQLCNGASRTSLTRFLWKFYWSAKI